MGIASKLGSSGPAVQYGAPSNGGQPSYSPYQPQQSAGQQAGQQTGQQAGQQAGQQPGLTGYPDIYGANNGYPAVNAAQPSQQYPPQQFWGAPPPNQMQQQFASFHAPLPNVLNLKSIEVKLSQIVRQNQLHTFYSPQAIAQLAQVVNRANLGGLAQHWNLPQQMLLDLVSLSLYDTVIMCDDSGSMTLFEGGERIKDLKAILERAASVCGLLDTDGISISTMNTGFQRNHVKTPYEAAEFVNRIEFAGGTPLGTMLDQKILQPFVYTPARSGRLLKPVHVIIITDGEPTFEPAGQVRAVIKRAKEYLKTTRYGAGAVAFQFAQVGTDVQAQAFLAKLDTDSKIGKMVDCTSCYEQEQAEYLQQSGINLTPDMYLNKLCLGAIDRSYDEQDESSKKKPGFLKRIFA